jgi:hypothetical protein
LLVVRISKPCKFAPTAIDFATFDISKSSRHESADW